MRKWIIVPLMLMLLEGMVPAFAQQQSGDYITVKKSDLPPNLLKKIQAVENPRPTPLITHRWFFLMHGSAGGFSTNVFVVAGPFKDQADCNELNAWAKKNYATVSRCWNSAG